MCAAGRSCDSCKIQINVRRRLDQNLIRQFDNHRDICSTRAPTRELVFALPILPSTQTGQRGKRYRVPTSKSCYCVPRIWGFAPRRFAGLTSARSLRNLIYGISFLMKRNEIGLEKYFLPTVATATARESTCRTATPSRVSHSKTVSCVSINRPAPSATDARSQQIETGSWRNALSMVAISRQSLQAGVACDWVRFSGGYYQHSQALPGSARRRALKLVRSP